MSEQKPKPQKSSDLSGSELSNSNSGAPGLQKNALEWGVFALSLLLVSATLIYLGREILTDNPAPPHITLHLGKPRPLENSTSGEPSFIVSVQAANKGGDTAEGVHVEVEMQRGTEEPQKADFDIDFLPRGSKREGWVAFKGEEKGAKLTARVLGYEIP